MSGHWALVEVMNEARGEIWITIQALPKLHQVARPASWRGVAELAHWSLLDLTECRVVAFGLTAAAAREALEGYLRSMGKTRWRIIRGRKSGGAAA